MPHSDLEKRKFVVGLGNPGREYARTRHNVGFAVLALLRRRWGLDKGRKKFGGRVWQARPAKSGQGERVVLLLEPHTYMNCAGQAVREMAAFHQADLTDVLVVLDDLALPLGRLRVRGGGSSGGHNGLADVLVCLGTEEVPRLRIGIGSPPPDRDGRDFVLSPFAEGEVGPVAAAVEKAAQAVEDWVFNGTQYVMDRYNRKEDSQDPPAGAEPAQP